MLITIDTSNITDTDRSLLMLVLTGVPGMPEPTITEAAPTPTVTTEDAPKRTRRTKAQIEADRLAAEATEKKATESALGEDETAGLDDYTDEPSVTLEQATELAVKLIASDRPAMVELLAKYVPEGAPRRVSNVPETKLAAFATDVAKAQVKADQRAAAKADA